MRELEFPTYFDQVGEFRAVTGTATPSLPIIPIEGVWRFWAGFLEEELNELAADCARGDVAGALDSLVDLQYVLTNTIQSFGMQDVFEEAFAIVHASNMSKTCTTWEEVELTMTHYQMQGIDVSYKRVSDRYVVYRTDNGKTLKNTTWSSPDFTHLIS